MRRGGYACIVLIPSLSEDAFMKIRYFLVLALLLLVITPVAADMYCEMNIVGGGTEYVR